ncbi:MAG: sodium-dependent transporter [Thermoplasmata archaeon]|nr:MAG: sodium-dependent transporter [Thermoplasmata archaeon]
MAEDRFTSRWGFILAALGAAIGTGNIWRFPREAAKYGGGAFIVAWIIALFLWSIPLLMTEFAIGRKTRKSVIGSFAEFLGEKYVWMGAWIVFVSTAINFYYSVVMGWTIRYFFLSASGGLYKGVNTSSLWYSFISTPYKVIAFHVIAVLLGWFVVRRGVSKGIELTNKILLPSLLFLITVAAIWSLTLPNAINGLKYMFIPRVHMFGNAEMWIHALAQSAWSCSAGMGMAITYAVYTKKREDVALNAFIVGFGNNSASLIAGVAVLCTLFGLSPTIADAYRGIEAGSSGLTFIHLAHLFSLMPVGALIAAIFFLSMSFAALTSLISGFEIAICSLMDAGFERKRAANYIALATLLFGLPSAISISVLENQDAVWSLGLLPSGLFISFIAIKYGASKFRSAFINTEDSDIFVGKWWDLIICLLLPAEFFIMFVWFMAEVVKTSPLTFATLVIQWGTVMFLLVRFRKKLYSIFYSRKEGKKK